jgi:hypothetical protein
MTITPNYCVPPSLHTYIKKVMVNNYYLYQSITAKRITTSISTNNNMYFMASITATCTSPTQFINKPCIHSYKQFQLHFTSTNFNASWHPDPLHHTDAQFKSTVYQVTDLQRFCCNVNVLSQNLIKKEKFIAITLSFRDHENLIKIIQQKMLQNKTTNRK